MKLKSLDLLAYGHFSQTHLPLAETGKSLHIIYGPNEAGKSTTLRALTSLLFGFGHATIDNFLHDAKDLRVGGTLQRDDGKLLSVMRRRGKSNTLLSPTGEALDDNLMTSYLPGLDRELFLHHYGLDHARLVEGGTAILENQGEPNATLFGVASAFLGLKHLLDGLKSDAELLFKPRGRTGPTLNTLATKLEELRKRQKELTYRGDTHHSQEKQIQEARTSQQQLSVASRELRTRLQRAERLLKAIPLVRQRQEVVEQLDALLDARILAPDFATRRQGSHTRLTDLELQTRQLDQEIRDRQEQLDALLIDTGLLELSAEISSLHADSGRIQKNELDLHSLQLRLSDEEHSARRLLRELGHSFDTSQPGYLQAAFEKFNLSLARRERIKSLSSHHLVKLQSLKTAQSQRETLATELERKAESLRALPPTPDTLPLQQAIAQARRAGALEDSLKKTEQELSQGENQAHQELSRLGYWQKGLATLSTTQLPLNETVTRFETHFNRLDAELKTARDRLKQHQQSRLHVEEQLKALQLAGDVPTEATLKEARDKRELVWTVLRQLWLEQGMTGEVASQHLAPEIDAHRPLVQLYPGLVRDADERADRLRREADRVAKLAQQQAALEREERALSDCQREVEGLEQSRHRLSDEWLSAWQGVGLSVETPLPPPEMKSWLGRAQRIQELVPRLDAVRARQEQLRGEIDRHLASVTDALNATGRPFPASLSANGQPSLDALLIHAERVVDDAKRLDEQRRTLTRALEELADKQKQTERESREAEQSLQQWRTDWAEAITALNLSAEASPDEASTQLRLIDEFLRHYDEAKNFRSRSQGITRDNQGFGQRVKDVCAKVAPDLLETPAPTAARTLESRRSQEQERSTRRKSLETQQETQIRKLKSLELALLDVRREFQQCLDEAGVERYEDLFQVEARSAQKVEAQRRLSQLDQQLSLTAGTQSLREWIEEVQRESFDDVQQGLQQGQEQQKALEQQLQALSERIGSLDGGLKLQDGTSKASELAEESQQLLAELREGTEQYLRLKLSQSLLEHAMGEWRQRHQGPLLARASQLFRTLTLERYGRLQLDYDEKDRQVLVAMRGERPEPVTVEGMSQGTRDQLFLALRLASLELDLKQREKVPFVIDDLLINFDDGRSEATLKLLLELSRITQVIFFTHHPHLLELAGRVLPSSELHVLELQR